MMKAFAGIVLAAFLSSAAVGQSAKPRPGFEVTDVHPSPPIRNTTLSRVLEPVLFRAGMQGERYEVRNATMVDLIRTAYGVDPERVVGGPAWMDVSARGIAFASFVWMSFKIERLFRLESRPTVPAVAMPEQTTV